MALNVTLSAGLRDRVPGYDPVAGLPVELWAGETLNAGGLAEKLGLPKAEIKLVLVNGRRTTLAQPLTDGDRVGFFPAIAGG